MTNSGKKRLTALALALVMTLALAVPGLADGEGTAWEDMEYVHYDAQGFYDGLDQLAELAKSGDEQGVEALYDQLFNELVQANTYYVIADLHYNMDVTDASWEEEQRYSDTLTTEMNDAFYTACSGILSTPCGDTFREHVGQDAAKVFQEYVPATERELELLDRESELINQYYEKQNEAGSLTYAYKGADWTEDMLAGRQGDLLYGRDPDGYWEVYYGLQAALNQQVGPIFLELVQIRTELAQIWGYDDYAAGVYEDDYGRDFTPEQAQMLCDAVKQFSAEYYDGLYYSDLWFMSDSVAPVLTTQEQLQTLGQYVGRVDPKLEQAWQFMMDYDLCYLTDDPDSTDTGYTTLLMAYDCPFIYNRTYGSYMDLDDLSHEFGHFTDHYYNKAPDVISSVGSYDLFEIHSTGLEALFTNFYGEIYDEGADVAEFLVLGGMVESIISGCIEDEFQRRVYAQPDMTLDEINRTYADVCREYGQNTEEMEYGWQYVPHNFESPLYYISYAVSTLAALQIWDEAEEDFDAGVATYMDVLDRGAYADGYLTVLEKCGMRLFTEEGAVQDICQPVIDHMQSIERAVAYGQAAA